jgi:hypothetical protein
MNEHFCLWAKKNDLLTKLIFFNMQWIKYFLKCQKFTPPTWAWILGWSWVLSIFDSMTVFRLVEICKFYWFILPPPHRCHSIIRISSTIHFGLSNWLEKVALFSIRTKSMLCGLVSILIIQLWIFNFIF